LDFRLLKGIIPVINWYFAFIVSISCHLFYFRIVMSNAICPCNRTPAPGC